MKPLDVVVSRVSPVLKGVGYRRFGPTFNRGREPGVVQVINFQGSKYGDEFTVNLGVQIRELWDLQAESGYEVARRLRVEMPDLLKGIPDPAPPKPSRYGFEPDCQLRLRLGRLIPPHQDKWWKYSQLDAAVEAVSAELRERALPYLDLYASREDIASRWMTGSAWRFAGDWIGSQPGQGALLKAKLLRGIGREVEAADLLRKTVQQSEGQRWHQTAVWLAHRIQKG